MGDADEAIVDVAVAVGVEERAVDEESEESVELSIELGSNDAG